MDKLISSSFQFYILNKFNNNTHLKDIFPISNIFVRDYE